MEEQYQHLLHVGLTFKALMMDDHERRKSELEQKYYDEEITKRRKKYLGPDRTSEEIPATSLWRYQHQTKGPTTSQSLAPAFVEDSTHRGQSRNTSSGLPPVGDTPGNSQHQQEEDLLEASLEQGFQSRTNNGSSPPSSSSSSHHSSSNHSHLEDSEECSDEDTEEMRANHPFLHGHGQDRQHLQQHSDQEFQSRTGNGSSPPSSSSSSHHTSPNHSHLEDSGECSDEDTEEMRANHPSIHGHGQDHQHLQQHSDQEFQSRTGIGSSPPSSSSSSHHSSPNHSHLQDSEECSDEEIQANCQYHHGYAEDQDLQHLQQQPDQDQDLQHDEGHVQDNEDHLNAEENL